MSQGKSGGGLGCLLIILIFIPIILIYSALNWLGSFGSTVTPNVIGESVYSGESKLEDAGFQSKNIHIESMIKGDNYNSSWEICKQSISPEQKTRKRSSIDLQAAPECSKIDENGSPISITIPSMVGLSLDKAMALIRDNVGPLSEIVKSDATPDNRGVWDESAWIVCSQTPDAGVSAAQNSKIELRYARDTTECSTGTVTLSEKQKEAIEDANKATADGLTEYSARVPCEIWFDSNFAGKSKIHWIMDLRYADVVDEGYGEMWQFNVGVTIGDAYKGVMVCKVTGSEDSPVLVDAFVNY